MNKIPVGTYSKRFVGGFCYANVSLLHTCVNTQARTHIRQRLIHYLLKQEQRICLRVKTLVVISQIAGFAWLYYYFIMQVNPTDCGKI